MSTIPKTALDQHIAILGKTGSGKSYAAKGIVERLLDEKRQICVIDPTAAWWGLRLGHDGKSKGYDVVLLGGAHADIPLSERSGAAVARLVTQQHANVVIDTSGLTVGEYTRWFIDFAGTLYTTIRSPLHLVIDEAHYFMPQGKSPDVDAGKMLHAGNRLMSGGRSLGIRGMMITQRPAKLHKDSLTCADTLIAMRVLAPQDRSAVKEWIDGAGDQILGKQVLDSLAQLKRGEGWIWYPEGGHLQRTQFPKLTTYDSSATPAHGSKAGPSVREIDLNEVRSAMADAVKEAEANDPKLLRAEIAKLKASRLVVDDQKAIERAVAARDREWESKIMEVQRQSQGFVTRLRKIGELAHLNGESVPITIERPTGHQSVAAFDNSSRKQSEPKSPAGDIGKGERTILTAVAQHGQGVTREQLTVLTGYKRSSRDTYLQRLRSARLIEDGDTITATASGIDALGSDYEPLPTGDALRAYWMERLTGGERAIFAAVCDAYPQPINRETITESTGYARSSRDTYLQRLSSRRLVTTNRGIRASDELFSG